MSDFSSGPNLKINGILSAAATLVAAGMFHTRAVKIAFELHKEIATTVWKEELDKVQSTMFGLSAVRHIEFGIKGKDNDAGTTTETVLG